MSALLTLLATLALTILVEGAGMLALGLFGCLGPSVRTGRALYAGLLCNLLTNPLLNLLLLVAVWLFGVAARLWLLLPLELAVVAGEAALYRKLLGWRGRRALVVSLLLNALSYLTGLLLFGL